MSASSSTTPVNFSAVKTLIIDSDESSSAILLEMMRGFGANALTLATTGEDAKAHLTNQLCDLVISEAEMPDIKILDLIKWLRGNETSSLRFIPVVAFTGYTQKGLVTSLRDCGANMVLRKPVTPNVLFDHLAWVSRASRAFVETPSFCGPDRRFKSVGPPNGSVGRRHDDVSAKIGAATEPNMSQNEIDALIKPIRVVS